MGTRFATTEESPFSDQIKGAVLNLKHDGGATEADTLYGKNFDEIPVRVMHSPVAVMLNTAPVIKDPGPLSDHTKSDHSRTSQALQQGNCWGT